MNLTTVLDVPAMLDLLDAARGTEAAALRTWHEHLRARVDALAQDPAYDTSLVRQVLRRVSYAETNESDLAP